MAALALTEHDGRFFELEALRARTWALMDLSRRCLDSPLSLTLPERVISEYEQLGQDFQLAVKRLSEAHASSA